MRREEHVRIKIWSTNMDMALNSRADFSKNKKESEKDKPESETKLEIILTYNKIR
jgi:hypothetical protein